MPIVPQVICGGLNKYIQHSNVLLLQLIFIEADHEALLNAELSEITISGIKHLKISVHPSSLGRLYPGIPVIKSIYVRQHYNGLLAALPFQYPEIRCVLTGTPGVGKSLFGVYLVYQILNNKFVQFNKLLYRRFEDSAGTQYLAFVREHGANKWHPASVHDETFYPDIFISDDSKEEFLVMGEAFNLLITSPRVSTCVICLPFTC